MKKVLILTAGFGDGHNTAARNVAEALDLISDEVKVEVLDVFQSSLGLLNDVLKKAYLGLTRFTSVQLYIIKHQPLLRLDIGIFLFRVRWHGCKQFMQRHLLKDMHADDL